jgi:hypothetical protein
MECKINSANSEIRNESLLSHSSCIYNRTNYGNSVLPSSINHLIRQLFMIEYPIRFTLTCCSISLGSISSITRYYSRQYSSYSVGVSSDRMDWTFIIGHLRSCAAVSQAPNRSDLESIFYYRLCVSFEMRNDVRDLFIGTRDSS